MEGSRIATTLESLSKAFESDPAKGPARYAAATAKVLNGLEMPGNRPSWRAARDRHADFDGRRKLFPKSRLVLQGDFGSMLRDNDRFACRAARS